MRYGGHIKFNDDDEWRLVSNQGDIPDGRVKFVEPVAIVDIIYQHEHVGFMMDLLMRRRGEVVNQRVLGLNRTKLTFKLPLSKLITEFLNAVNSRSDGFSSLNYDMTGTVPVKLVKMDVAVGGSVVGGMSCVDPVEQAAVRGRQRVDRL